MNRKKFLSFLFLGCSLFLGAADVPDFKQMWNESDEVKRCVLQDLMQARIDKLPKAEFDNFDKDPAVKSDNPVLKFYDAALERVLADIPATKVRPGTVVIWYLYNMGFIIKTPESCFGVDIHHRNAVRLAPLLDFTAVTHKHGDHFSKPLLNEMNSLKKVIISNFFQNPGLTKSPEYTRKLPGGITVHCGEADHNSRLKKFTMPMEFVCKTGDKEFVFFTSGDVCSEKFLKRKSEKIHLYAIHPRCGMLTIKGVKRLDPQMTFIGHLQELGHEINRWRWSFAVGRKDQQILDKIKKSAYVPVWGEKFLWDGEMVSTVKAAPRKEASKHP